MQIAIGEIDDAVVQEFVEESQSVFPRQQGVENCTHLSTEGFDEQQETAAELLDVIAGAMGLDMVSRGGSVASVRAYLRRRSPHLAPDGKGAYNCGCGRGPSPVGPGGARGVDT